MTEDSMHQPSSVNSIIGQTAAREELRPAYGGVSPPMNQSCCIFREPLQRLKMMMMILWFGITQLDHYMDMPKRVDPSVDDGVEDIR
jgi:hypothetical protein